MPAPNQSAFLFDGRAPIGVLSSNLFILAAPVLPVPVAGPCPGVGHRVGARPVGGGVTSIPEAPNV